MELVYGMVSSAPEVTILWRYTNTFIIIIIFFIIIFKPTSRKPVGS